MMKTNVHGVRGPSDTHCVRWPTHRPGPRRRDSQTISGMSLVGEVEGGEQLDDVEMKGVTGGRVVFRVQAGPTVPSGSIDLVRQPPVGDN
jgi:hypothetical protein